MSLKETFRDALISYIQSYEVSQDRIIDLVNDIEKVIITSPLFTVLNEISDSYDLKAIKNDVMWVEDKVNKVRYFIGFLENPKIEINLVGEFRLEFYPTKNQILIKILNGYYSSKIIFSWKSNIDNIYKRVQQVDKEDKNKLEDKLLKLLSSLKDDKILDVATENLIKAISKL